ncbi:MAG: hypothetical protein JWN44_6848 [Myxococcales bacterium]|nr:hypothetical protein [Myxococcales bacterium]
MIGRAMGALLAPITGAVSAVRHARMFHPDGVIYQARVAPATATAMPEVAARLAGPALMRLSSAWWRGRKELPDVLGVAIRFRRRAEPSAEAEPGDQDLLLATIRHPWTMPFAPLSTHVHDFLANDYYGVSPFMLEGVGLVYLRAVPSPPRASEGGRAERLARAVADGAARFTLEAKRRGTSSWQPIVTIELIGPVTIDEQALRFWPYLTARGIEPRGFVHALRRAAYRSSQHARGADRASAGG